MAWCKFQVLVVAAVSVMACCMSGVMAAEQNPGDPVVRMVHGDHPVLSSLYYVRSILNDKALWHVLLCDRTRMRIMIRRPELFREIQREPHFIRQMMLIPEIRNELLNNEQMVEEMLSNRNIASEIIRNSAMMQEIEKRDRLRLIMLEREADILQELLMEPAQSENLTAVSLPPS